MESQQPLLWYPTLTSRRSFLLELRKAPSPSRHRLGRSAATDHFWTSPPISSCGLDLLRRRSHQGDLLTYAFPVWNLGRITLIHEVLNTQVPPGTTLDSVRISGTPGLGTCTTPPYQGTGQIVCHENSAMAPNTTWTVRLAVKVTAPSGTVITENAAATEDTADPNPANNTATVSTTVQ